MTLFLIVLLVMFFVYVGCAVINHKPGMDTIFPPATGGESKDSKTDSMMEISPPLAVGEAELIQTPAQEKEVSTTALETTTSTPSSVSAESQMLPAESPQGAKSPHVETGEQEKVRNPITGELAHIPNNYRFAKKWIKDALVAEGLVDRVYKSGELNDPGLNNKTKDAMHQLARLEKYRV